MINTRKNGCTDTSSNIDLLDANQQLNTPIYVLSLKRDTLRRKLLEERFPAYWRYFSVIDAVDAQHRPSHPPLAPHTKRHPLTQTEIACALSHLKALQAFLESGKKCCIIFEDDVEGDDATLTQALVLMENMPDDGFTLLGGQQGLRNRRFVYGMPINFGGYSAWELTTLSRRFVSRACCYGLTVSAARILIEQQRQSLERADHWRTLLKPVRSVYFADLFSHPLDLSQSHIEGQRKVSQGNVFKRLSNDGLIYTLHSQLIKAWLVLAAPWLGSKPIANENFKSRSNT